MFKHMFFKFMYPLYDDEGGADIGPVGDLDALSGGDDDSEDADGKDDKGNEDTGEEDQGDPDAEDEEEGDKEDKEEESEEEEEELTEEEKEAEKLLSSWTDIKKKYPDFAKQFPDVKAALFREQQYTDIFATPKDAEEANSRSEVLEQMETDLIGKADPTGLFDVIGKTKPEALDKLAMNILPYFQEKNKELYYKMASVPIKQLLRAAYAQGKDKDLGRAAEHIHKYFFDNIDVNSAIPGEEKKTGDGRTAKEKELEEKLNAINQKEENSFIKSMDDSYMSKITSHIREGLDKDERLTEWAKSRIVDEATRELKRQMDADPRYSKTVTSMIKQARAAGFTNDFKSRIVNTALVRAKSLVPSLRSKLVAEALGQKKKANTDQKQQENVTRFKSKPKGSSGNKPTTPKDDLSILRG